MADEDSRASDAGSGRLWTDPRGEEEHTRWLAPKTAIAPRQPDGGAGDPPPEPPSGSRRPWSLIGLAAIAVVVVLVAVLLGANLLGGRDDDGGGAPVALPVSPGPAPADARSKTVRAIYAAASPSVVRIRVDEAGGTATGTGFVVDSDGTIVTNAHVVAGASTVKVRFGDHSAEVDGDVLGSDASSDLAVVRVDPDKTRNLTPLTLADSDEVQVGDLAVAIGYPLNLDKTATQGIVSGLGRAIKAPNGFSIDKVIQTDAPINPGNSGGPLLDSAGRVIGVNSQIATAGGSGGNVGIGFAVPSNTVREVVPRLRSGAPIRRAYLGVSTVASTAAAGALVADVIAGGPAEQAGLQAGDTIVSVAGRDVRVPEDVSTAIERRRPGDEVEIEVRRAGDEQTLRVTLGTRPGSAPGSQAGP